MNCPVGCERLLALFPRGKSCPEQSAAKVSLRTFTQSHFVLLDPSAYLAPLAAFGSCLRLFSNACLSECWSATPALGWVAFFGSFPRSVAPAEGLFNPARPCFWSY